MLAPSPNPVSSRFLPWVTGEMTPLLPDDPGLLPPETGLTPQKPQGSGQEGVAGSFPKPGFMGQ